MEIFWAGQELAEAERDLSKEDEQSYDKYHKYF